MVFIGQSTKLSGLKLWECPKFKFFLDNLYNLRYDLFTICIVVLFWSINEEYFCRKLRKNVR